jgi:hypothetical protein
LKYRVLAGPWFLSQISAVDSVEYEAGILLCSFPKKKKLLCSYSSWTSCVARPATEQAQDFMRNMGLGMVADQLADLKLGELLDTPPPGLDEAVAIAKVRGWAEGTGDLNWDCLWGLKQGVRACRGSLATVSSITNKSAVHTH